MDKSWLNMPHRPIQYAQGIRDFIALASNHLDGAGRARCPCKKCNNRMYRHFQEVKDHLYDNGFDKDYTSWIYHGEPLDVASDDDDDDTDLGGEGVRYDGLDDMLEDVRQSTHRDSQVSDIQHGEASSSYIPDATDGGAFAGHHNTSDGNTMSFDRLLNKARQPLYPGCEKYSTLDFLMKMFHLKIINRWSNKSFDMVLALVKSALPAGERLPKSHYEAKQLLRDLGLGYISIHACQYDCALFWGTENKDLENCPVCNASRYKINEGKTKKVPVKVLRYFPLKPRLQRLFMSRMTAEDMRWHKEKRVGEENILRHPADSEAWKEFDKEHQWFSSDPRNVRLGLASDGFNPFSDMSSIYSMWPVLLMPYNMPPWKCMKEPFIFMSLLIPGPKAPRNDIDVYLQPLIEELKELWVHGVDTYDVVTKQTFRLHAALLWTINDFPAFANLSGWSTKGKLACPTCNKDTCSMYLKNGRKLCYMNHCRFLQPRHPLTKRARQLFSGNNWSRLPPNKLTGEDVLKQLEHVEEQGYGKHPEYKKRKRTETELNWTKHSIFFRLPYWRTLKLPHNIDVMHTEKNICESVLGTLLNLDGKIKDSAKARLDLAELGIRQELHLIPMGNKFVVPPACYTLCLAERRIFCEWLKTVKFPDGYASNISRCVNVTDCKVHGLKSHDCHVLLQRVLPVALRGFLASDVSSALIELGFFFRELFCKTLKVELLEKLEKDIAVILCKLELIFPPAFFDVMVHLAVHLPREAIVGGPVQYRWMYPIERFLKTLKQYVRNRAHPEGSIAEAYIDSECLTFCSMYLQGIETRFNREDRHYDGGQVKQTKGLHVFSHNVRPLGAPNYITMSSKDFNKARYYVLNNSEEISSYLDEHMVELQKHSSRDLEKRQEQHFAEWFRARMEQLYYEKSPKATDDLYSLSCGPDHRVTRYSGCIINGIRFHTKDREKTLRTQNSGVVVKGGDQSNDIDFYGVLADVIELEYIFGKRVWLFKCDWWDVSNKKTGIHVDRYFISVNVSRKWYKDDPFVLAAQTSQVFYVADTKLRGDWQVAQKIVHRNMFDVLGKEEEIGVHQNAETYQQEEQLIVDEILSDEVTLVQMNRDDVNLDEAEEVDANEVFNNIVDANQTDDTIMINDYDIEEDDTLIEYCTEEEILSSDNDTDID